MRILLRAIDTALRNIVFVVALFFPGFVLSVFSSLAAWLGLAMLDRAGNWSEQIASGGYVAAIVELGSLALERAIPGTSPTGTIVTAATLIGIGLGLGVLGVFLEALIYAYLAGGILTGLSDKDGPFRDACRRWLGPMVRYSLAAVPIFIVVILAAGLLALLLPLSGINGLIAKFAVFGLLLGIVNGMLELGRASMVVGDDSRVGRALGRGFGSIARPRVFFPAAVYWVLFGLLSYVFSVDVVGAFVAVPALSVAPAFLVHQIAALAGAFIKLLRLALAVELAKIA